MTEKRDVRVPTEALVDWVYTYTPMQGRCPACGDNALSPLGEDDGDAYEFMQQIGHPPGFDPVPFLAVACYCCGNVTWFLKDLVVEGLSLGVNDGT